MLTALRIADFAILEAVELTFGPGLTAVTGETGAGKSILVDALGVVLGGRASERAVRHGCLSAEVEAQFEAVGQPGVRAALDEAGISLDDQGALVLRRVIGSGAGKNRCHVNGRLVPLHTLREIAGQLVDLCAQHAHHRLLDPAAHLDLLDRFAGHLDLRQAFEAAHAAWRATGRDLDALRARQRQAADRLDWLRFVHHEIAELAPVAGELAQIQARVARLRAADQLVRALSEAGHALDGDGGAREAASRSARALERHAAIDPTCAAYGERMREIEALCGELAFDLHAHARASRGDERELPRLAERQDKILRMIKKHGGSEEALIARQAEVAAELDADATELRLHELERAETRQRGEVDGLARELTERRTLAAPALADRMAAIVHHLGMPAAALRVDVAPRALSHSGADAVCLCLRANRGEAEGPLHEVASGGELSRLLLALQRALGDAASSQARTDGQATATDGLPTAIFDEVDAGLSGATGIVLGRFLAEVGRRQQVVCISHLPQVAAAADHHVVVRKREVGGRTRSEVEGLADSGRADELARMLGTPAAGGETARAHALRLIAEQRRPFD